VAAAAAVGAAAAAGWLLEPFLRQLLRVLGLLLVGMPVLLLLLLLALLEALLQLALLAQHLHAVAVHWWPFGLYMQARPSTEGDLSTAVLFTDLLVSWFTHACRIKYCQISQMLTVLCQMDAMAIKVLRHF